MIETSLDQKRDAKGGLPEVKIVTGSIEDLKAYSDISIAFEVHECVDLDALRTGTIKTIPVKPRWKDYNEIEDERPDQMSTRFDVARWGIFLAQEGSERLGGTIVAFPNPLDGHANEPDSAALVDIRVAPEWRKKGIGKALWLAAEDWARLKRIRQLMVETQDINVAACRFYQRMGCEILSINPSGYDPELNEVQLIWVKRLGTG